MAELQNSNALGILSSPQPSFTDKETEAQGREEKNQWKNKDPASTPHPVFSPVYNTALRNQFKVNLLNLNMYN